MKLFETSLKTLAFLGGEWDESSKKLAYTKRIYIPYSLGALCCISTSMYIICEAKLFYDYLLASLILLAAFECGIVGAIIYFNLNKLEKFIESSQNMSIKSKCISFS